MTEIAARWPWRLALVVGAYCGVLPLLTPVQALLAVAVPVAVGLMVWLLDVPGRWVPAFLLSAVLLPPLPVAMGDSGPHPGLVMAAAGFLELATRRWRIERDGVMQPALFLVVVLAASTCSAAATAGVAVAAGSFVRVLLFSISICVFVAARTGATFLRPLWMAAVGSALFACLDFYFQFPAPANFAPQFVWLSTGVYRRAQGVFYEASTLGNFCAFFLVMALVALSNRRFALPISRKWIAAGAVVFATALILSYSRGSLVNILVAGAALMFVWRENLPWRRIVAAVAVAAAGGAITAAKLFPAFAELYWKRAQASATFLTSATDGILSGRVANWEVLLEFLREHPLYLLTGVGYKTLAYSDFVGRQLVSDNVYLGMLVEAGVLGLVAVVWLNVAILKAAYRAAKSRDGEAAFFGAWMFCFWAGESVQMLSGDLLTYWRVLPLYFWVLAMIFRRRGAETQRSN